MATSCRLTTGAEGRQRGWGAATGADVEDARHAASSKLRIRWDFPVMSIEFLCISISILYIYDYIWDFYEIVMGIQVILCLSTWKMYIYMSSNLLLVTLYNSNHPLPPPEPPTIDAYFINPYKHGCWCLRRLRGPDYIVMAHEYPKGLCTCQWMFVAIGGGCCFIRL